MNLSGLELYYLIFKAYRIPLTTALGAEVFDAHAQILFHNLVSI